MTRLTPSPIDVGLRLEVPGHPIGIGKITQRAPPHFHRPRQHSHDGSVQLTHTQGADTRCRCGRANTCQKEHLGGIDVSNPYHQPPRQQHPLAGLV